MGNLTKQSESDGIYFNPVCNHCAYNKFDGNCFAFPLGIPDEILSGKNNHKKPFKGDNGIQFEPVKELTNSNQRG
jgi:hypothetical protein